MLKWVAYFGNNSVRKSKLLVDLQILFTVCPRGVVQASIRSFGDREWLYLKTYYSLSVLHCVVDYYFYIKMIVNNYLRISIYLFVASYRYSFEIVNR